MVQVSILNFDNKEHRASEVVVIYIVAYKFKNSSRKVSRIELKVVRVKSLKLLSDSDYPSSRKDREKERKIRLNRPAADDRSPITCWACAEGRERATDWPRFSDGESSQKERLHLSVHAL
ncbi:hypothetical protein CDAR_86621 [Caerostris darwini]|uniref:Uncharacterized protein n=1 Tax=Caerostris darwini TaxID=1538125 RepID=A0AAV4UGQ0_9ARAC|nr:hypothetical protein CDAR_86621 [Caerostris darwini]